MEHLHNGWLNLFGLLKGNCINILIIFIEFLNIEATRYPIIIGEYNLMCFIRVIVFEVNGDRQQIVLLQKMTDKNDKESLICLHKDKKLQKVVGQYQSSKKNNNNSNIILNIDNNGNNKDMMQRNSNINITTAKAVI